MITRSSSSIQNGLPTPELLRSVIAEHAQGLGRLAHLRAYYDGRHAIASRRRAAGLPNTRVMHAFPRYITTMASGYLIGRPVAYETDGDGAALSALLRAYERSAIDNVDAELARNASIYGRGVELIYAGADARPRSVSVDPRDAFVVYGDSVACEPILGVYLARRYGEDRRFEGCDVLAATREALSHWHIDAPNAPGTPTFLGAEKHFFGRVPLIEYWNDESEKGDFEDVISLIDAYELLQSDRLNDKSQFVDALLVLYGCTLETDERGRTPGEQLREDKALSLPDGDARAEWLCKQLGEADTEVLRRALCDDIHKMSMVPDMTDQNFAGNSSGVAMRYKLLGLEQLTRIKERWFREALRERVRAYAACLERLGAPCLDADSVRMVFSRALPVNELESAQTLSNLRGILTDEELERRALRLGTN